MEAEIRLFSSSHSNYLPYFSLADRKTLKRTMLIEFHRIIGVSFKAMP